MWIFSYYMKTWRTDEHMYRHVFFVTRNSNYKVKHMGYHFLYSAYFNFFTFLLFPMCIWLVLFSNIRNMQEKHKCAKGKAAFTVNFFTDSFVFYVTWPWKKLDE